MLSPLYSIAQAFSLLVQKERKRQVKPNQPIFSDSLRWMLMLPIITILGLIFFLTITQMTGPNYFVITAKGQAMSRENVSNFMDIHKEIIKTGLSLRIWSHTTRALLIELNKIRTSLTKVNMAIIKLSDKTMAISEPIIRINTIGSIRERGQWQIYVELQLVWWL